MELGTSRVRACGPQGKPAQACQGLTQGNVRARRSGVPSFAVSVVSLPAAGASASWFWLFQRGYLSETPRVSSFELLAPRNVAQLPTHQRHHWQNSIETFFAAIVGFALASSVCVVSAAHESSRVLE